MIIKIDDDYINDILDNGMSDIEIEKFEKIFFKMHEKKIFVRIDKREFLDFLLEKYGDSFSRWSRDIIIKLKSDYTSIMSSIKQIDYLFNITKDKRIYCDKTKGISKCSIPIKELPEELNSYLYSENEEDADFYYEVYKKLNNSPTSIFCRGFGGGSGKGITKKLIEDGVIFFEIVDSDRDYPGAKMGSTAKSIKKQFNKNRLYWDLLILNVREKENLLPIGSVVLKEKDTPQVLQILNKCDDVNALNYFDIKSGISNEDYERKKIDKNWETLNIPIIDYDKKENKNTNYLVCGVGDGFITNLFKNNGINYSTFLDNCTKTQRKDWEDIFYLITVYGYCYNLITS